MSSNFSRYLLPLIQNDLNKKMVLLAGPRQVGKTTLSESLLKIQSGIYLNWDFDEDRDLILKGKWPKGRQFLVFDEIHKYRQWRNTIKGLYDKRKSELKILVTGSARLDYYRRGGDSLQGRYFFYRLHPLSVRELNIRSNKSLQELLNLSGFPEPYFSKNINEKTRWSLQYRSLLIRQDLQALENVQEIDLMERLAIRLPDLVGSPLSYNSLSEDLQISPATAKRWCDILERLYFIFRIYPFGTAKIKAIKKQAKHYHYDWSLPENAGAKLENLVAGHLIKWCDFECDTKGREVELRYFRTTDNKEVDFVICEKGKPIVFIECKWSHKKNTHSLKYLKKKFPQARAVQLFVNEDVRSFVDDSNIEHLSIIDFLNELI